MFVCAVGDGVAGSRDVLSGAGSCMASGQKQKDCKTDNSDCSEIAHGGAPLAKTWPLSEPAAPRIGCNQDRIFGSNAGDASTGQGSFLFLCYSWRLRGYGPEFSRYKASANISAFTMTGGQTLHPTRIDDDSVSILPPELGTGVSTGDIRQPRNFLTGGITAGHRRRRCCRVTEAGPSMILPYSKSSRGSSAASGSGHYIAP